MTEVQSSAMAVSRVFTLQRLFANFRSRPFVFLQSRPFLQPLLQHFTHFPVALPVSVGLKIPGVLTGLWESILRAVPKKKTSHRKKRQRFMAGKGLKDVTALNKCSACGNIKRAHLLCPFCIGGQSGKIL